MNLKGDPMSMVLRSVIVALFLLIAIPAWASSFNVDITKLSPDVAKALVEDMQKKKAEPPITPSQAHEWAGVGKEVAAAISETAKGLSLEVNQFVSTPVGWWAMFFLIWALLGAKLAKIALGSIFVLLGAWIWWRSLKHFFWSNYEFQNSESQAWSAIFHVVGAGFLLVMTCVLIFGVL
jgi:hypothetical protein